MEEMKKEIKEQFADLTEKAPCGMCIHYTLDTSTDMITYTDINGRGKLCGKCEKCSWKGICKPEPEEMKLQQSTYVEIYNLIDDEMRKAAEQREEATDFLAREDVNIRCVAAEKALEKIRTSTKRMREMEDLLKRFEEQIEEPMQ